MAQSAPQTRVLEAERFVVKDHSGKERAGLGLTADGPSLEFYDARSGTIRIALTSNEGRQGLAFHDGTGRPQLTLFGAAEGTGLEVFDGNGTHRALLAYGPDSAVLLWDANGKVVFSTPGK